MATSPDISPRQRIAAALANILQQARVPIIVVVAVGLAFVVAYSVYSEVVNKRAMQATAVAEALQKDYSDWQSESDASKKTDLEKNIASQIASILKKYPHSYAAQRALFVEGDLAYDKKDWKSADKAYEQLAASFPTSYLAVASLADAAAAQEELGNLQAAVDLEKKILDFKGLTPEIPRALFAIGRLDEGLGKTDDAKTYYNKLIDGYPSSGWTNLARDRIIYLAAQAGTEPASSDAGTSQGSSTTGTSKSQ